MHSSSAFFLALRHQNTNTVYKMEPSIEESTKIKQLDTLNSQRIDDFLKTVTFFLDIPLTGCFLHVKIKCI